MRVRPPAPQVPERGESLNAQPLLRSKTSEYGRNGGCPTEHRGVEGMVVFQQGNRLFVRNPTSKESP